jgi:septum formation protein
VVVLASGSPRRRELLERIGYQLVVDAADVDESPISGETPGDYVLRLATRKAEVVAARHPGQVVLGADTTVTVDDQILGKAADADQARAMLARLFGREHQVLTGFAAVGGGQTVTGLATTAVVMRQPAAVEVAGYLASGEWQGKAGAYAVQGMAAAFVTEVRGSITSVIGLPLAEAVEAIKRVGGPAPDMSRGQPA